MATVYTGEPFDANCIVIIPNRPIDVHDLPKQCQKLALIKQYEDDAAGWKENIAQDSAAVQRKDDIKHRRQFISDIILKGLPDIARTSGMCLTDECIEGIPPELVEQAQKEQACGEAGAENYRIFVQRFGNASGIEKSA